MKKLISFIVIAAMLIGCFTVGAIASGTPTMTVSSENAKPGDTVTVKFSIANNPGVMALSVPVSYDTARLESPTFTESGMTGWTFGTVALWDASSNSTFEGTMFEITFHVKDDAANGIAVVSIGAVEAMNIDEEEIAFSVVSGGVEVKAPHTHEWDNGTITTPATCTTDGVKTFTCSGCDEIKTETVPALGHNWSEWTVTTEASCSAKGTETRVCANDESHTETRDIAIDTANHDWGDWVVTTPATETAEGVETRVCKNDSTHTETRSIPKLDHVHKLVTTEAVAATCETAGNIEYYACSNCGKLFRDDAGTTEIQLSDTVVAALGHNWDDGTVTALATCTEDGVLTYICKNDSTHTKTAVIPATGHNWGEWTVTTAATCSATGTETRVCANDEGHTETRDIAIDTANHDWGDWVVTTPATETAEGVETRVCKNDSTHTETRSIPKLDHVHKLVKTEAEAATCETAGNIEYYTCSDCGKLFNDDAGTTEIQLSDTVVAALGHNWDGGTVTKLATCTEDGVLTYICKNDSTHTKTAVIPATGHNWGEWTVTAAATCSATGTETRVCANDESHTETRDIAIDNNAHDWGDWVVTTPATETAEGVETRVCKNDSTHTETRSIPKLDHVHKLVKTEAEAATCETAGNIEYYTCSDCGKLFSDAAGTNEIMLTDTVIDALDHDWDEGVITTLPTCTESGIRSYICQRDASHTKTEPVSPTGHSWGEWTVITPATCSSDGLESRICKNDESHTEIRAISKDTDAHDWGEWTVTKQATEFEEGIETRVCKNDESHTETREIPKLSHIHSLVKVDAVAATCEADGNIEYYICAGCGKLFNSEEGSTEIENADTVIAALGHSWDGGRVTAIATPDSNGEITYTCEYCGLTRVENFEILYAMPIVEVGVAGGKAVEESLVAPIVINDGYSENKISFYEITMSVSLDNGRSFVPVTTETMPMDGVEVTIPYPAGTNAEEYDFIVTHRLDNGSVETITSTKSADGLKIKVKSFSPFAVGYKKNSENSSTETPKPTASSKPDTNDTNKNNGSPKTGDDTSVVLYVLVLIFCIIGSCTIIFGNKKPKTLSHKR